MNRRIATATIAAAVGLVAAPLVSNAGPVTPAPGMEKCYGIAAKGFNDCAARAHSCAGQATKDRDPSSYVYLPAGACSKIAGGKTSST